jgi:hypothetical protein
MKISKKPLLAFCLLCWAGTTLAQDVILKKDNTTVLSKVIEVTGTEIKYKKWSNQDGPTYSINRSEVTSINYQNGDVDKFTDKAATNPVPQQSVEPKPQVQTPIVQPQTESKKAESPYSRGMHYNYNGMIIPQFSLSIGAAIPMGKFGTTTDKYTSFYDFCVPFQIFAEEIGNINQVGIGAAKTGFNGSLKLHCPLYENGKSILGMPLKIGVLYNGITESEKQTFKSILEPAVSETLNEEYGVYAFDFSVTKFPSFYNFSIMTGVDYTYYFNKNIALLAEANIGLNVNHVSSIQMNNRLGGTYIGTYNSTPVYAMKEFNFIYKTKANFTYEIGGGLLLFDLFSISLFYMGNSPAQLSYDIDAANISDGPARLAQKLEVSALSIQLGVHF